MRVQMMITISGGRGDGSPWPEAGEFLECGQEEALGLIQGRMAVAAPLPEAPFETADAPGLGTEFRGTPAPPAASAAPESASAPPDPACPLPAAPKQAWVDWAVWRGAERDEATAMTKGALMAAYGPPARGE